MRARSNPWLAVLTILAGSALAVSAATAGCGGSTESEPAAPTDTGSADTGTVVIVDSAKPDTGTVMMDSEVTYDVPGSLFDAAVPDVVFEGGKTAAGCYGCALATCKKEAEACDADPRCRGLFLCVVSDCGAAFTDFSCALGCAGKFGVTGLGDPVIGKVQTLGTCVQNKCAAECPSVDAGAIADAPAPSDAKTDAPGGMGFKFAGPGEGAKSFQSIDPKVGDVLMSVAATFNSAPVARDELIQKFSH